jgi:H-type lectin domain
MSSTDQISIWHTKNNAATTDVGKKNPKMIPYECEENETPNIVVGFKMISMSNSITGHRIGGRVHESSVYADMFAINIDSLPHTKLYNGGAMWFKYAATNADLQSAVVKVSNVASNLKARVTRRIAFERQYTKQPKVFVGISGFDISVEWHLHVYATDIDVNGFTLHVDPWGLTELYSSHVSWISFSADRRDITTGTFSSHDNGNFNGMVNINPPLSAAPQIFYTISEFDCDENQDMEIRIDIASVSASRFNWRIAEAGSEKANYDISGSYLAVVL